MTEIRHTLTTMGWTDHQPNLLPESLNITTDPIQIEQTPSQWKAAVASSRSFIPNNIKVVDKSYMSCSLVSKVWQESIDSVLAEYSLNSEQDCAFRHVANHTSSPDSDQLKMYITGMAGTGKTQVLKSLVKFSNRKTSPITFSLSLPLAVCCSSKRFNIPLSFWDQQ